jgi:hypothetical protein
VQTGTLYPSVGCVEIGFLAVIIYQIALHEASSIQQKAASEDHTFRHHSP